MGIYIKIEIDCPEEIGARELEMGREMLIEKLKRLIVVAKSMKAGEDFRDEYVTGSRMRLPKEDGAEVSAGGEEVKV